MASLATGLISHGRHLKNNTKKAKCGSTDTPQNNYNAASAFTTTRGEPSVRRRVRRRCDDGIMRRTNTGIVRGVRSPSPPLRTMNLGETPWRVLSALVGRDVLKRHARTQQQLQKQQKVPSDFFVGIATEQCKLTPPELAVLF